MAALRLHFARSTEYHLSEEAAGVCKYCCEFHECLIATVVSFLLFFNLRVLAFSLLFVVCSFFVVF